MHHAERTHREFSPSQSERFINCPGSVARVRSAPTPPQTQDAITGTKAHELLERALQIGTRDLSLAANDIKLDLAAYNGSGLTTSVDTALDLIASIYKEGNIFNDAVLWSEVTTAVPCSVNPGQADGTVDCAIYSEMSGELDVIDFKNGVKPVEATGSTQLIQLALGLIHDQRLVKSTADVTQVRMHIIQPRAFHKLGPWRTWTLTPAEVIAYQAKLEKYVKAGMQPNAPLNPGDYCKWCPAAAFCPALEHRALTTATGVHFASIKDVKLPSLPDPAQLDVERLAYIKSAFSLLNSWMASVDRQIDTLLRQNVHVPGWKLVEAAPRRYFVGEEKERMPKLAALIGCNTWDLYNVTPKGITEIEAMVVEAFRQRVQLKRKNMASEDARKALAFFTTKESSGALSIAPEADSRPAVNLAEKHFSNIRGVLPPPSKQET